MSKHYYPFRRRILATGSSTGINNLDDDKVNAYRVYTYKRIVVINRTSAFTRLLLGVMSGGVFHTYEEQQNPLAATLYPFEPRGGMDVTEGEHVRARCTGVTEGDELVLFVSGHYVIEDGPDHEGDAREARGGA